MKKQTTRLMIVFALVWSLMCSVRAADRMLIPGGYTVGIQMETGGPVITGFEKNSPAKTAGLRRGDVITAVDGVDIHTISQLRECVGKRQLIITVLRNGKSGQFCVKPEEERLGIYVRDCIAGIGTVTFYDPETGSFGALGHGVNDRDTMQLLQSAGGMVVRSEIKDVEKGTRGTPGELRGSFDMRQVLGSVKQNTEQGIFGTLKIEPAGKALPVGNADDVQKGSAVILANVRGTETETFDVEIMEIHRQKDAGSRNLLLKVTDPELLGITGGIVQGMSGSPVIQNGRIVGAVTHVLVNDPTKGYGIFIENMLEVAG